MFLGQDRFFEIFRFCVVGGLSFLLDYGLLYFLTEHVGVYYLYSSGISFTVSVVFNYWLCVVYVFRAARNQTARQATVFIGSSVLGLGLNQLCMWVFVDFFAMHYMLAKIVATIVVTFWNYVMKRKALKG